MKTNPNNPYPLTEELEREFDQKFQAASESSTHVLHDRYDDYDDKINRIGLTRIKDDPDVYIIERKWCGFDQKMIGKISQFEIRYVVDFLNNYETPINPTTIQDELKLLRQMAGFMIDMSRHIRAGMPNNSYSKYNPLYTIPMGLHKLAAEYRDKFGMP